VVTLVSAPHEVCEGVAFEVCQESTDEVLRYLDERESGGYERLKVNVTLEGGERVQAWTWMAPPDNSNYLGDASQDVMLAQILGSTGASGANRDYVMNLAGELQRLGIEDIHVQNLARLVREASAD
jgi:cation transport regulator ChaC